jgi:hypothetical protein
MPLQKAPPTSSLDTNITSSTDRNTLQERRRTLQTISELSPQTSTFPDMVHAMSKAGSNSFDQGTVSSARNKSIRRKSLPNQGVPVGYDTRKSPPIMATTKAPPLRRSMTDPTDRNRHSVRRSSTEYLLESHRLSGMSTPRCRHSQDLSLSSIAEGAQFVPQQRNNLVYPTQRYYNQSVALAKQSTSGPGRYSEEWNARREREHVIREQAIIAARARRGMDQRILIGRSPSTSSISSLPTARPKEIYIRRQESQKHIYRHAPQSSVTHPRVLPNERTSQGQNPNYVNGTYANRPVPRRASSSGQPLASVQRDMLQRSRSLAADSSWGYHPNSTVKSIPHVARASTSQMLAAPTLQRRRPPGRTKSDGSLSPSPISTCSSNLSGTSHSTGQTQRSSMDPNTAGIRHYAQQQVNSGRLEVFPALADVPHSTIGSQSVVNPRPRKSSQSSQASRRTSLNHLSNPTQSQHSTQSSTAGQRSSQGVDDIIHRENPDKRGMSGATGTFQGSNVLRKRERPAGLRSNMGDMGSAQAAKEKAREKMRERVKRANELEDEKAKELVKEKKEKRMPSLFCGLFGK